MTQTTIQRIDDPVSERQYDFANEMAENHWAELVSPVPRGSGVRVYLEQSSVTPGSLFSTAREYGYVCTGGSFEDAKDIKSRVRAFTGGYPSLEKDRYEYLDFAPTNVYEFDCDWCGEHKRGERSASRYKPDDEWDGEYPRPMWTLCRDCDPEYDEEGNHDPTGSVEHPRIGTV